MEIKSIENAYRRYASIYDLLFGAVFQPGRRTIVERMNCRPGQRILEVGVGTGLSLPLYPKDVQLYGIDISSEMLVRAHARKTRTRLENVVQLSVMDAEHMDFEDSSFDKVVAMHVASVVTDPERLVDEMRRVCKPDGQIIFVNHFHSRNLLLGSFENLIAPLSGQLGFRPDFSLDRFVDETGLDTTAIRRVNLFRFCTVLEARNNKLFEPEAMASAVAV